MPSLPGICTETVRSACTPCCQNKRIELFVQRLAGRLQLGRQLAQQQRGHRAVLVADVAAGHVAVRFFGAVDEQVRPELVDRLGDPLEADQQVADRPHAVAIADAADHLRRDQRFHDEVLRRNAATFAASFQHVIGQTGGSVAAVAPVSVDEQYPKARDDEELRAANRDLIAPGLDARRA